MQKIKGIYITISCLLLLSQLGFLLVLIYNKMQLGRVLYYGNIEEQNPGFEKYFTILEILLYSTFILVILWSVLTPFAVISNRRLYKEKINIFIGLLGFAMAIILLLTDPFGIFKWFTS